MNKKRAAGLIGNVEKVEVVIVVREAMINSFNNISHAKKALTLRGWNPPNFACLDDPDILESALADVKENRVQLLQNEGLTSEPHKHLSHRVNEILSLEVRD